MNLQPTFYVRPKYYSPVFPKTVTLEILKSSALNRVFSPLLIGMFFELGMFLVRLFILAESVQVEEKSPIFLPLNFREFITFSEKTNLLLVTLMHPNYNTSVVDSKKN